MIKLKKWHILFGMVLIIVWFICMGTILSNKVSLTMNGFAVDNTGRLYIGKGYGIEVYEGDTFLRKISPKTSRGYMFTIVDGDTIVVSTASFVYHMDLDGKVLAKEEDKGTKVYNELQRNKNSFIDENGLNYTLTRPFGRAQISDGEKVIYKMPTLDYTVLVTMALCSVALIWYIIVILRTQKRKT